MDERTALEDLNQALATAGLRPSATAVQMLARVVDQRVEQKLRSLGGDLLASHGPESTTPDSQLASLGGYLLGHDWS